MFKQFIYFRKSERVGIIVLASTLLIIISFNILSPEIGQTENEDTKLENAIQAYETAKIADKKRPPKSLKIKNFNPCKDSYKQLLAAGLPKHIARNIINYRDKGGRYRQRQDLKKLYLVTDSLFNIIEPFITIPTPKMERRQIRPNSVASKQKEFKRPEKLTAGTQIELNRADTTDLKKIPGIGSYRAKKIIRHRRRLGGFCTIEQLAEIDLKPQDYSKWITIDKDEIKRINLNTTPFKELLSHPYLNYEQVKALFNLKREANKIISFKQLEFLPEFSQKQVSQLKSYFFL